MRLSIKKTCSIPGCNKRPGYKETGYCTKHQMRFVRHGSPYYVRPKKEELPGFNRPSHGSVNDRGYIYIYINGKVIAKHVHVVQEALGVELPKGSEVHHINHDPLDNDLENLVLCFSKKAHCALHEFTRNIPLRPKPPKLSITLADILQPVRRN